MSGEEIRFTRNGKEVRFEVGEKVENKLNKKDGKKIFQNLFEAIANSDGNKELSADEMKMVKDLQTIFAKTGEDRKSNGAQVLDADDMKLAEEFKSSNMGIKDFIAKKLQEVTAAKSAEEVVVKKEIPASNTEEEETVVVEEEKPDEQNDSKAQTVVKKEVTQADKNKQFNDAMQLLAKKKFGAQKDELTQKFTKEVEVNKPLYTIAKEALKDELGKEPSMKEINDRIAQIALVNGIKDVNNIPRGKKIYVGSDTPAPVQGQETPVQGQGEVPTKGRETGTVPVEKPAGGLDVKPDTELNGWMKQDAVPEIDDFTKPAGAEIEYYASMVDGKPEDKYVYKQDGVIFEANDQTELKAKVKVLNDALAEFTKTVENETAEAKQTRFQAAIDALIGLGTESAVKKAQEKLAENKANVSADYYAEKTAAMIKSGNPALIEQMLGTDGAKFAEVVNNSPVVQEAIGAVLKSLVDKFNNDEYLTLDEQRIKAVLDKCVDKAGVTVEAKPAQAAQAATETTPAKEATPEVVAKTLVTDKEGNSYYKAALTENGAFKDVEFRAKDSEQLNEFMIKLKAATSNEAKTALFKEFAEKTNVDSELLKSMVKEASKLKADAGVVVKLLENANLDLVYAMDTSHFADVEANKETDVAASQDKTNVQNAIKARIEAIMADDTLRALPENAKYLDKIKGIQIPAESTAITKVSYLEGWAREEVEVPTGENDTSGNEIKVTVDKYTKEGQADVYRVEVENPMPGTANFKVEADSAEAVVELKKQIEALALDIPGEGATLDAEQKRDNLEKLAKLAEFCPTDSLLDTIAYTLRSNTLIDKNDPDAKALVQELLLTRDSEVVSFLVKDFGDNIDNQLFENDPVALKTLAAMFKEIRDLENQGVKLTPEQIALKDVLDDCVVKMQSFVQNAGDNHQEVLRFDGEGNVVYALDTIDDSGASYDKASQNKALRDLYSGEDRFASEDEVRCVIYDPIMGKDKTTLASLVSAYGAIGALNKQELVDLINLDTVDAELLSYINFNNLDSDMSAEDKKAVQEAYVAKAKELFANMGKVGDTEQLDPANARYLSSILGKIDSINAETTTDGVTTDADDVVIAEIIGNFFTGEGENAVTTIKNFRRFTYEEMKGLADAVAKHGTDAQKTALANMITFEDMEDGQFVRAIQGGFPYDGTATNKRCNELADSMSKEEILDFLDRISYYKDFPFDNIMKNYSGDTEVVTKLLTLIDKQNIMSDQTRKALVAAVVNEENVVTIPEGVDVTRLRHLLPQEKAASGSGETATAEVKMDAKEQALFKKVVESLNKNDLDTIKTMLNQAKVSIDLKNAVYDKVKNLIKENINESAFIKNLMGYKYECFTKVQSIKNYLISLKPEGLSPEAKKDVIDTLIEVYGHFDNTLHELAIENGWLTKFEVKVGDKSCNNIYTYGDSENLLEFNKREEENKSFYLEVKYSDLIKHLGEADGKAKAATILEDLDDWGGYHNLTTYLNEDGHITKDNVVALLQNFNKDGRQGIIEYMDREWGGPTVAQMERIPNALIEYAISKGLSETEDPLLTLKNLITASDRVDGGKDPSEEDYKSHSYAKSIDDAMKKVLDKLFPSETE